MMAAMCTMSAQAAVKQKTPDEIKAIVTDSARQVGINRNIAHALVSVESNYNPGAFANRKFAGLTQVHIVYHAKLLKGKPFDPTQNSLAGFSILKEHLKSCKGNYKCALKKYQGGSPKQQEKYANKIIAISNRINHDRI